jgi:biopolymer transport protein TolR
MSMAVGRKKGVRADINITPYIDILLVLLIIFMTVAPMKPHDHPIRIPQPAPANMPKEIQQDTIIVEMDFDHTVKLNNQPMTLDKLETTLTAVFSRRANKSMFIRGDTALPYGDVFPLLDIAKRSGAKDIALIEKGYVKDTPVATASIGSH